MYMTTNFNIVHNSSLALIAFVLLALPFSAVRAADLGDDTGWYTDSYTDSYPMDTSYSDTGWYTDSYTDSYPMDYGYSDYGYNDYSSGFMGSSYLGGGFMGGSSYIPSRPSAPSNTNTNINENYCTSGSCNTAINAPTTVTVTNPTYQTPVCPSGFYGTYPNCYHQTYTQPPVYQNPPIAYNQTPYIALSAVPYTGLDLGFWGTIAYWGFLILWCLVAAYLIVVKKVQNRILRSLNTFLFGDSATSVSHAVASMPVAAAPVPAPSIKQIDAIDDFILSQINRVRA